MLARRAAALSAFFLVGLIGNKAAHAFCRTTTCEDCPQVSRECVEEGAPLYWPIHCVTYDVQKDASRYADFDTANTVADLAFHTWLDNVTCPATGRGPSFILQNLGPVACDRHEYNDQQNSYGGNANIIVFRDDDWTATRDPHALALTTVTYNRNTGEIYDADIEVNSHIQLAGMRGISTSDVVPSDSFDLQSILTHEAGHFLGLAHSDKPCSPSDHDCPSMDAMYQAGSSDFRTLEPDDIDGICAIYPVGRVEFDNQCAPRHGFAPDCGVSGSRGCCTTAPGAAPTRGGEGLFAVALGLGVLALRARRQST